jgi:hypothetical protein
LGKLRQHATRGSFHDLPGECATASIGRGMALAVLLRKRGSGETLSPEVFYKGWLRLRGLSLPPYFALGQSPTPKSFRATDPSR